MGAILAVRLRMDAINPVAVWRAVMCVRAAGGTHRIGKATGMGLAPMIAGLDWATAATLATAVGTLVLAVATFASVRSANRAARGAEAAFQSNLRPVLVTSRLQDPMQKLRWMDNHWVHLDGGMASAELVDGAIYLAISVRNVGSGIAVPIAWSVNSEASRSDMPHQDPDSFRTQTRDLYVAPGDMGFWHAA